MTTRLVASERFFYNGRNVEKDEEFDAEDIDVPILTHHHTPKATTLEINPGKSKSEPKKEPEPNLKGYRRRDLRSDD